MGDFNQDFNSYGIFSLIHKGFSEVFLEEKRMIIKK